MSIPQFIKKNEKLLIIIAKFSACKKIKLKKQTFKPLLVSHRHSQQYSGHWTEGVCSVCEGQLGPKLWLIKDMTLGSATHCKNRSCVIEL